MRSSPDRSTSLAKLSGFSYCQTFADSKGGVEPPGRGGGHRRLDGLQRGGGGALRQPYKTIDDLKGKVVARTDPLSGSGYLIPTRGVPRHGEAGRRVLQEPAFRRACAERARRAEGHL